MTVLLLLLLLTVVLHADASRDGVLPLPIVGEAHKHTKRALYNFILPFDHRKIKTVI